MIELEINGVNVGRADVALREFSQKLQKLPERVGPHIAVALKEYLERVGTVLAERHGNPYPATTESTLSRRTGELAAALKEGAKVIGNSLQDLGGTITLPDYARIQEFGGTIRARNAQYLAIPLPPALNSDGTPIKQNASDWDRTFVAVSKRGNLILFQRQTRSITPLYLLKRQVEIRPRLGMRDELVTELGWFEARAMNAVLNAVVNP